MAFSFSSCAITKPFLRVQERSLNCEVVRQNGVSSLVKCASKESSELPEKGSKLEIGSPIIFIEAPKMIKTAATMPCLRVNTGQVKAGDVGRYSSHHQEIQFSIHFMQLECKLFNLPTNKKVLYYN